MWSENGLQLFTVEGSRYCDYSVGMKSHFDHSAYSSVLFIDSMIALECKPLESLPWHELDSSGPVLIMVVPQVNAEIDKRKRDGRLGKKARAFNRLIAPAAESGKPEKIADGPPDVFISVARCDRINWDVLDDLDPHEGDHKVVAQILHTIDVPNRRKALISQDTNPIFLGSSHGLKCHRLPDGWLLAPEPHPKEKDIVRLKQRIRELEANEPEAHFSLKFDVALPLTIYQVAPLSVTEQEQLIFEVTSDNPKVSQHKASFTTTFSYDHEYDDKYRKFLEQTVPRYVKNLNQSLEIHFAQIPFQFRLQNTGHIQIEDLILTLSAMGGTLHDRFTFRSVFKPIAPQPEPHDILSAPLSRIDIRQPVRDRHDVEFIERPDGGKNVQVQCADFRHGREWYFEGIATIDPRKPNPFQIEVELTASNLRGKKTQMFEIGYDLAAAQVDDLVDLPERKYLKKFPLFSQYQDALDRKDYCWFDFGNDADEA